MAPSHKLRVAINGIVRDRLIRDGLVKGEAVETETARVQGLHQRRESAGRELLGGRRGGFPSAVQAPGA